MDYDTQLLREYTETGSERAFRELVERHIHLVNTTALRSVAGDVHLARDVTQMVFTHLARKSAALPRDVVLSGWLHRHTCFTAAKTLRTEIRRRHRERIAMEIDAANEGSPHDSHWQLLAPVLNDALNHLGAQDRDAIVLRYLQCRNLRSIGLAIGTSEDAAQKRITRALEKLRGFLSGRGITFSSAMLVESLDAGAKTPVPPGLSATISTAALSGAAAVKTSFTITTLKYMITSKLSLTAATVLAVAGATAIVITNHRSLAADSSVPAPASSAQNGADTSTNAAKSTIEPAVPSAEVAQSSANGAQLQPAPTSAATTLSSAAINEPNSAANEYHSMTVQVSKGVVTTTTDDSGISKTQTQALPGSGAISGGGTTSSYAVSSGTAAASIFPTPTGDPISSKVNPDGSTTSNYANPQGGTLQVTVSADGNFRSMKIISLGPRSN